MTHSHANRSCYEDTPSTELIDPENGGDGEQEFNDTDDAGGQERCRVAVEADGLEDHGAGLFVSSVCKRLGFELTRSSLCCVLIQVSKSRETEVGTYALIPFHCWNNMTKVCPVSARSMYRDRQTYSSDSSLEKRLIGDQRLIVIQSDHKPTME